MGIDNDIQSILVSTIDLLHYHQWGNFGVFDRCFRKSCDLLRLEFSDETILRKYRTFGFAFLRNTGFIDIYSSGTITQWSVSDGCLAQLEEKKFAVVGNTEFRAKVLGLFPENSIEVLWPHGYFEALPSNICLYPPIPIVKVGSAKVEGVAKELGISVTANLQDRLFGAIPSIDSIIGQCISIREVPPTFEPGSLERFNFEEQLWSRYDNVLISDEGIFRRNFEYQAPDYYVGFIRDGKLLVGHAQEREWLLICGIALLQRKIPMKYKRRNGSVSFEIISGFSLPVLLERCLRSGNLLGPVSNNRWREYANISERSIWKLRSALPVFSL